MFEHIWVVDRLQRLGVSHYFQPQIKESLDYVFRYWTEKGICWARNSNVHDIDDTAMGFRLLRLHGYDVSPNVFRHFEKDGEFVCFAGQYTQAVTGMYNLYRASQIIFPGERLLEEANKFSCMFLKEKQASNQLLDKWIITKDLPGEVGYALDFPWYASLPRVETRFYLDHYGGEDDVWIGKTLYKMPLVNNNSYLQLAKLDFNKCQHLHRLELKTLQEWYMQNNLEYYGTSQSDLLSAYFLSAASIFEPKRSEERLAWAKTSILMKTITSYFNHETTSSEHKRYFLYEFKNISTTPKDYLINGRRLSEENEKGQRLVGTLVGTINQLSLDPLMAHGRDIRHALCHTWKKWIQTGEGEGEAEVLVETINLCSGHKDGLSTTSSSSQYQRLTDITNGVCHHLRDYKILDEKMRSRIEMGMQELAQLVLQNSEEDGGMDAEMKQTFLTVAKSFYYSAHCNPRTIDSHISKVLFEKVG